MTAPPVPAEILPQWLLNRTRVIRTPEQARSVGATAGELVLYWTHHAVRDNHNPALDAARIIANALGLPLLVYQGLNGNHRYNNDRHHTFILEGARDLQQALHRRGISYALSVNSPDRAASPLITLARRAALIISEEFPVPPFAGWVSSLAAKVRAPVWLVDTACILPMQTIKPGFDRAFEFRKALIRRFDAALTSPYPPEPQITDQAFNGPLGFDSIDLSRADIGQMCASAAIDHSVGPAPYCVGGMTAANARWRHFLAHDLAHYDKRRNDAHAHPNAVSRLSPYLHHGHLSSFQIARDAWHHESAGARKFADELLIWRELAHHFCFHQDAATLESVRALPQWAQTSLAGHADDVREQRYQAEQLSRARTDSELWNICQRSLLIHGELHNNIRMTWGKAIAGWTGSPDEALSTLIDLNHRYALDGSDPNSYGGLLWCLGLFDRPFKPAQPVFGSIRTRPLSTHEQRVDLPALATHVSRYRGRTAPQVIVIGGGIAGLSAARTLHDNGLNVRVLDRGRRPGGRLATDGDGFDYGAPDFTVTDPRFASVVAMLESQGLVRTRVLTTSRWQPQTGGARLQADSGRITRKICLPGMASLAMHLAEGLDITSDARVSAVRRDDRHWQITGQGAGLPAKADFLVLAMPLEQARRLGDEINHELGPASDQFSEPIWVTMLSFAQPIDPAIDRLDFAAHPVLRRAICESRKAVGIGAANWVIHSTAGWAAANLDKPPDHVAQQMAGAFRQALDIQCPVLSSRAHRWRYANPVGKRITGVIWNQDSRLALCGDWCANGDVESAYLSGVAAAGRIMAGDRALIHNQPERFGGPSLIPHSGC